MAKMFEILDDKKSPITISDAFFFKIYVLSGLMNVRTAFIGRVASRARFRLSEASKLKISMSPL